MKISDNKTIAIHGLCAAVQLYLLITSENMLFNSIFLTFSLAVIGIILWRQPIVQSILRRREAMLDLARSEHFILVHNITDKGGIGATLNAEIPSEYCIRVLSACASELSKAEQAGNSLINELGIKKQGEEE